MSIFLMSQSNLMFQSIINRRCSIEHTIAINMEVGNSFLIDVKMFNACFLLTNSLYHLSFDKDCAWLFSFCLYGANYLNICLTIESQVCKFFLNFTNILLSAILQDHNTFIIYDIFRFVIKVITFLFFFFGCKGFFIKSLFLFLFKS